MQEDQQPQETRTKTQELGQFAAPWVKGATRVASVTGSAVFEKENLELDLPKGTVRLKRRVDGLAKVTGSKVFAYDIRARDMAGWPDEQAHGFLAMAMRADAPFEGLDLSLLGEGLQPDYLITARELQDAGLDYSDADAFGSDMLLPQGQVPHMLGHPLAILVYKDFERFYVAKRIYKERREQIIRHGETCGPLEQEPWSSFRLVRVEGQDGAKSDQDIFNSMDDSVVGASYDGPSVIWPEPKLDGDDMQRGMAHAKAIRDELDTPPDSWHVIEREYYSPYIDAAALEPNNVNCWYDADARRLEILVACQNPQKLAGDSAAMLANSRFDVTDIQVHPGYTVGYGTKDVAPFPYFGVVAAFFTEGLPVRIALDREEMFQEAIKRHPIHMRYKLAVDCETLKFQTFVADLDLDGGGQANNATHATVVSGTTDSQGIYYTPRSDLAAVGHASRAPMAGSVRGFGAIEVQIGTEMLVEELAQELGVDSMELRLRNALQTGERNCAGAWPLTERRFAEIIEIDRKRPVWVEREQRKKEFEREHPALKYGVGYAVEMKGYGNSNEGVCASVELSPDGYVRLQHIGVEFGTGIVGSQAVRCALWFGKIADEVATSAVDWSPLELYDTQSPFIMNKAYQDKMAADPHWTPIVSSPTSASNGAYYFTHGTDQAAKLIWERGILPAAAALWGTGLDAVRSARWVDGDLVLDGKAPLSLPELAARAHAMNGITAAMIHCFDRWGWAEADFVVQGETIRPPLDALTIKEGGGDWQRIERANVHYQAPETSSGRRFSSASALIELSVNRGTGVVNLLSHHTTAECGRVMVPEFVSGQIQGAIGQGIGHALYEGLPLYEGGPGTGHWNFNRYRLPRACNVAVWKHTTDILPETPQEPFPKGIAEVAQGPTIAAIGNAVAHAIGTYLRDFPLTEDKILEALAS